MEQKISTAAFQLDGKTIAGAVFAIGGGLTEEQRSMSSRRSLVGSPKHSA